MNFVVPALIDSFTFPLEVPEIPKSISYFFYCEKSQILKIEKILFIKNLSFLNNLYLLTITFSLFSSKNRILLGFKSL